MLWNIEVPRRRDRRRVSRRQRLGEIGLHDGAFGAQLERAVRAFAVARHFLEAVDVVAALEVARAEA